MNYGVCALNELVLYTSHLQKTSTETFEDMASFFDQKKFSRYIKAIRTAIGRESIEFKSGGKVKFLARTRNGGRGQHADLLVFDEAQELTDEQQASFTPCLSASSNPQIVYTGTPPDQSAPGAVFRRIRDKALAGEPGRAWAEWSVDEIGDISDKSRWYRSNPSLGTLILESTVEAEAADLAPDKFAIERLGWWTPVASAVEHVIDEAAWAACEVPEPPGGVMSAGVKVSFDRATLAICEKHDGGCYVEWIDTRPLTDGVGWVVGWLASRKSRLACVAVDGTSAASITSGLSDAGFPSRWVRACAPSDMSKAVAMTRDAVNGGTLSHNGEPALSDSACKTARRRIGSDGIGFEDYDGADATIVEACCLAVYASSLTKRKPGRKAVVYV